MLLHTNTIQSPYLVSIPFLAVILAMGGELGRDMIRAARMAEELRRSMESQKQMQDRFRLSVDASPSGVY